MKKLEVRTSRIPGEALLLLTAAVWGTGFVAQRKAMEGMQPFAFIALRFFLGCLVLLPVLILRWVRQKPAAGAGSKWKAGFKRLAVPGMISGLFLFAGTSLQQLGIITTSASKAGFLTSLYLVLVPLLGLLVGKKVNLWVWIGVVLALAGVWFLSLNLEMSIQRGDILILIGALFWALQILHPRSRSAGSGFWAIFHRRRFGFGRLPDHRKGSLGHRLGGMDALTVFRRGSGWDRLHIAGRWAKHG